MFCHLDMDCFYASIEIREHPHLRHRPLAVGGSSRRGVVTTCNYIARKSGVRSAMSGFEAKKLCPDLVFLPVRFDLYRKVSQELRSLLIDFAKNEYAMTPEIEMASIDECYFEVHAEPEELWHIGQRLRSCIQKQLGVTASLGIAPNKMLSKILSSMHKPNQQYMLKPEEVESFMLQLPVSAIPGVGPKASERLLAIGIQNCGELQKKSIEELSGIFGASWGWALHEKCRGQDNRRLQMSRERKSLSCERTLSRDLESLEDLENNLQKLWGDFQKRFSSQAQKKLSVAKCFVTLRFSDFKRTTKECVVSELRYEVFAELAREAFDRSRRGVRLLGLGVRYETKPTARPSDPRQLRLF